MRAVAVLPALGFGLGWGLSWCPSEHVTHNPAPAKSPGFTYVSPQSLPCLELRGLRTGQADLTWRVAGTERLRPSVEMLTAMLMPAKRRLLLPRMEASALLGAWGQHGPQGGDMGTGERGLQSSSVWEGSECGHGIPTSPSPTFFFQEPRTPGTASWSRLMASLLVGVGVGTERAWMGGA